MTIRRGSDAWYVRLSPADAAVMGCEWVPLPITADVNVFDAVAFARTVPMYDGTVTVAASPR